MSAFFVGRARSFFFARPGNCFYARLSASKMSVPWLAAQPHLRRHRPLRCPCLDLQRLGRLQTYFIGQKKKINSCGPASVAFTELISWMWSQDVVLQVPRRHLMKLKQTRQVKKWGEHGLASRNSVWCVHLLCYFFVMEFRSIQVCCFRYSLDSTACVIFCVFVVDLCHTCVCVSWNIGLFGIFMYQRYAEDMNNSSFPSRIAPSLTIWLRMPIIASYSLASPHTAKNAGFLRYRTCTFFFTSVRSVCFESCHVRRSDGREASFAFVRQVDVVP